MSLNGMKTLCEKKKDAGYQHFLLFTQCLQKALLLRVVRYRDCLVKCLDMKSCVFYFSASYCKVASCSNGNLSSHNISSIIDWIFPFSDHLFIPVPNKKVQTVSNLQHLGNAANELQLLRRVKKNIVEKGEYVGYLHFLPFPTTFSKCFYQLRIV